MFRKIARVKEIDIHYRIMGEGPLLFLLHPSPTSGLTMVPLMQLLANHFTVIAPDTPNYGLSDALPKVPETIYDFIPYFDSFFGQLKSQCNDDHSITIYGSATGAQIAIAYALTHPIKVKQLFIDNAAHFTYEQRAEILKNYFIDTTPKADGTHLQELWQMIQSLCVYFPWHTPIEENRFNTNEPTPQQIQFILNHILTASAAYKYGYLAAFAHEEAQYVQNLKIPTTIFKWLGSPILKYINQLLAHKMPANITIIETAQNINERNQLMQEKMILSLK
jgi:pimeloyl-ACP methyl ester carboxylesterase